MGRVRLFLSGLRVYPRQFWVLVGGTFVYVGGAALGFPYEGIFLRNELHVSMTLIGLVFGLVVIPVIPLQLLGGTFTDRFGRKTMILVAGVSAAVWFVGFAYAQTVWQIAVLVAIESAFGWPLFQTASTAMIADLLPEELRAEAFSISRVAMNLGVVVGPAVAGLALAAGASFRELFLSAATACGAFLVLSAVFLHETRPESAVQPEGQGGPAGRRGYGIVFADRRFLVFCAVALLLLFCLGQFGAIYSVFITSDLGVPFSTWGWLLAMNALIVATLGYPLVRAVRNVDKMLVLCVASVLVATGVGGSAFATGVASLAILIAVFSVGEILVAPIASAVVSDRAPEAVRGRYMGVWTVTWNGGMSLGPTFAGWAMDSFGGRDTFSAVLAVGLLGAVLFPLLRERSAVPVVDGDGEP